MTGVILTLLILLAIICSIFNGDTAALSAAALGGCGDAVSLCITLAGTMALWGGFMEIAERCGITQKVSRLLKAPLSKLLKGASDKTVDSISLNVTANLLGLGNAATPLGLKAMRELDKEQSADPRRGKARTAYFVLLNTASIQLIPVTVATMRLAHGSDSPWDCALPTVIVSAIALTFGLVTAKILYSERDDNYGNGGACYNACDTGNGDSKKSKRHRSFLQRRKGKSADGAGALPDADTADDGGQDV